MPDGLRVLLNAAFYGVGTMMFITATFAATDAAVDPHNPAPLALRIFWPVLCAVMAVASGRLLLIALGVLR